MKESHAFLNASGVFRSPNPYTVTPSSLIRVASRVKSLSDETMQKPLKRRVYSRSIASMMSALSVAFLPTVFANCCTGWMTFSLAAVFQLLSCVLVQSP